MRSAFWQHSFLFLIFLLVVMTQKVDWEWRVVSPPGPAPPAQSTVIVLPFPRDPAGTPLRSDGFLRKVAKPETKPASPFDGALEADLYLVTGYAIGDGHTPREITADGRKVRPGITAACRLPLGTMIYIEGIGPRVCEDYGTGPPGVENWIDVAYETPEEATQAGKKWMRVAVIR